MSNSFLSLKWVRERFKNYNSESSPDTRPQVSRSLSLHCMAAVMPNQLHNVSERKSYNAKHSVRLFLSKIDYTLLHNIQQVSLTQTHTHTHIYIQSGPKNVYALYSSISLE